VDNDDSAPYALLAGPALVARLQSPEAKACYEAKARVGHVAAVETVALSVVITVVGGVASLRRCLARLAPQSSSRPIEIIVPCDYTVSGVATLETEFPNVDFADMGTVRTRCRPESHAATHELYDRRKAFGLKRARGDVIALLDDTTTPDSDWCDRVVEAHSLPHGVIGGAVEYGGQGAMAWATYLQDFGRYQRPIPEGPACYLTDINVSYKRHVLGGIQDSWAERYSEATVHWALARKGVTLWQCPQIVVRQRREALPFWQALVERYCWGRLFGSVRARELSFFARLSYILLSPVLPLVLVLRILIKEIKARRPAGALLALPHLLSLTWAWCLGEFVGYLTKCEA